MRLGSLLAGLGLGAGLMYLLDPDRGRRRRAQIRDQVIHTRTLSADALNKRTRDLRNRAQGLVAEARRRTRQEEVSDELLVARVRSKMGLVVSRPRAIEVVADHGRVVLSGAVPTDEVERLLATVSAVPGVAIVENRLDELDEAEPQRQERS